MYNELYNAANEKHVGGKGDTMNQLGMALQILTPKMGGGYHALILTFKYVTPTSHTHTMVFSVGLNSRQVQQTKLIKKR